MSLRGNLLWLNGAMTPARTSPSCEPQRLPQPPGGRGLRSLSDHVAALARRPEGRRLMERIADAGLGSEDVGDLAELVGRDGSHRGGLIEWLVHQLPDETVTVVLLGVLVPELGAVARRLVRDGRLDPEEAEAGALASACEVVGLRGRRLRSEPLDVLWRAARQTSGMRRRCPVEVVALPADFDAPGPDVDPLERWPGILATAVAAGVLTPNQVVLIARSRMEGRPLSEIARALGRPYDAVRQERRRAERALRAFALGYVSGAW
jgi:DNA-directed RNA polymerase specialized sigma24 family protein